MTTRFAVLGVALLLGACQTTGTSGPSYQAGPIGQPDRWEYWHVGGDGYTVEPTDTSDWAQGRVQGSDQTTLIAECNGNDPTAFNISIEQREGRFTGMTQPFGIEVRSGGRTILSEDVAGVTAPQGPWPIDYEASRRLSNAMRKGSEVVFSFADGTSLGYTLRGSSRVMNRLACDSA